MRPEVNRRRYRRQLRLDALGYKDYRAYLRSGRWHDLKRRYRESDLPQDCICGEVDHVQLHHTTYERIGEELLTDLTPLCPPCHAMIHVLVDRGDIGLDFTGFVDERRAERNRAERRDLQGESDAARQDWLDEIDGWHDSLYVPASLAGKCHVMWGVFRELRKLREIVATMNYVPPA